jgi:hypothetical protein
MSGERCIELAGPERVKRLSRHANVEVIRRRKDRQVVEIQIHAQGDDSLKPPRHGNPLKYTFREELESSAPVFTLKHLPNHTRPIFTAVLDDCIAA